MRKPDFVADVSSSWFEVVSKPQGKDGVKCWAGRFGPGYLVRFGDVLATARAHLAYATAVDAEIPGGFVVKDLVPVVIGVDRVFAPMDLDWLGASLWYRTHCVNAGFVRVAVDEYGVLVAGAALAGAAAMLEGWHVIGDYRMMPRGEHELVGLFAWPEEEFGARADVTAYAKAAAHGVDGGPGTGCER